RGIIDQMLYDELVAKWKKQAEEQKEEGEGGSYYYNKKAYLGDRYISLVYGKYYQNKITIDTVAEYLNVKAKNLPTFEYMVMEGGKRK
ncbi:MAG TPA: ImmA/IrrE family metallo-endopeptidase, partial [Ignavibacteriales bacterium]|nr:ImmA/IrrE family metallo-endopeptidase [Ignavibacteriales bacterium]